MHLVAEQVREPAAKFPVGDGQAAAIPIPFPHRNQPSGCQHPAHLGDGPPRVGQMKQYLGGDDAVEGGIGERQVVGVAGPERHVGLTGCRALLRLGDERRTQIDTNRRTGCDERSQDLQVTAGPAADVQHPQAGPQFQRANAGLLAL